MARADVDPLFTRPQVSELVHFYLRDADPKHPHAEPLHAPLTGLPPVRVQVRDDEVLLDDSREYAASEVPDRVAHCHSLRRTDGRKTPHVALSAIRAV